MILYAAVLPGVFLLGLASTLFGARLLVNPARGALAMLWLIGGYAIISGAVMIAHAPRPRGTPERLEGRRA